MLTIEAVLPLSWRRIEPAEAPALARQFDAHNERLLKVLHLADAGATPEHREEPGASTDWHRLEAKVDLVIEMLAELIERTKSTLVPTAVRLTAGSLALWLESTSLRPGDYVAADLVVNPRVPKPLRFLTEVETVELDAGKSRVTLRLIEMTLPVQDEWERQIFLLHRRGLSRRPG